MKYVEVYIYNSKKQQHGGCFGGKMESQLGMNDNPRPFENTNSWRCFEVKWKVFQLKMLQFQRLAEPDVFGELSHQLHMSNEKNLGCLGYIGDYTTQLYGDCKKPL